MNPCSSYCFTLCLTLRSTEESTVSAGKKEKKNFRGNKYQEDTVRVAGVREVREREEKQQDRQSLFKRCRQDECSECV